MVAESGSALWPPWGLAAGSNNNNNDVRTRADQSFDRLPQQTDHVPGTPGGGAMAGEGGQTGRYPPERYWIGKGQGDLAKGKLVCQRVSELSARTDLAKQIRVLVKEHMVDRVRDRSGRAPEQDVELTREELVEEYLEGVRIVEHHFDEEHNTCSATAVMPKPPLPPQPARTAPSAPSSEPR